MHGNSNTVTKCGFKANYFLLEEIFKVLNSIQYFCLNIGFHV